MKYNKMITAAALAAVMTVSLAGCATSPLVQESQTTTATTTAEATTTAAQTEGTTAETTGSQNDIPAPVYGPEEPQGLYVTVNGVNVRLGMKFADVKDALGGEAKPSEEWKPCVGEGDSSMTSHFYQGAMIDVEPSTGSIIRILVDAEEVPGDTSLVTLAGKLKVGGPADQIKEIFGAPKEEDTDEDGTSYTFDYGKVQIMIQTKDNKIVNYNLYTAD